LVQLNSNFLVTLIKYLIEAISSSISLDCYYQTFSVYVVLVRAILLLLFIRREYVGLCLVFTRRIISSLLPLFFR